MPVDAATLYKIQQEVFARVGREMPHARQGMLDARLALRLTFTDIPARITVSGKAGRFEVHAGSDHVLPDFEVQLSSTTGHQVLLGQIRLSEAVWRGQIKWSGPFWQLPLLSDLFQAAQRVYPAVLHEHGLLPE
jgi:hypothetical protein